MGTTETKKAQLLELRRLLTAVGQLHAWQGDLLVQARKIVEATAGRPAVIPTRARGSARRRPGDRNHPQE
jgi:hypothetical protein